MAPRAMWTGQLRVSLVSFGVRMYAATETARKVSMNQLHKDCHQRVKSQLTCPTHGEISRSEIVKGYEYEKDTYVIIEADDLESIRLESKKSIDLVQFVDEDEIDPLYFNAPYYLGPDGPVAEEAFRVIREAMTRAGKTGIGTLTQNGREHIVAVSVSGKGFLMMTLRYASEVRGNDQFFADVTDGDVDEEQLELAVSIMNSKAGKFDPGAFQNRYQEAFFEIVKAKIDGAAPIKSDEVETPQGFNFMDALKESVAEAERVGALKKKPAAKSTRTRRTAKKPARKTTQKKKPAVKSVAGARKRTRKGA